MIQKYYLPFIIFLAIFFSFWKLGSNDLARWDESEYGVNAFEMIHNHDWVNYYYAGKPDTWNAKPPLSIWLIAFCYKIFGFNAFALRFTSAVCSVLFFIVAFKLVKLYRGELLAFITCLVLLSSKSIYGPHIGRSGDMDALLVFLLTASTYYFLLYLDFSRQKAIYPSALLLGLAFLAKGTPAFLLLPGLVLYCAISGKLMIVLKDKKWWLASSGTLLICSAWILLLCIFGNQFDTSTSYYKSHNAVETLFMHDTFQRLTDSKFDSDYNQGYLFFLSVLDTRLNIWNYIFYLSLLTGVVYLFQFRKEFLLYVKQIDNRLAVLSVCLISPVAILLTFATSKHGWYFAPVFLFISIVIALGINRWMHFNWFKFVWISILVFNLVRIFDYLNSSQAEVQNFFQANKVFLENAPRVLVLNLPPENIFLYLNWYHKKPVTLVENSSPGLNQSRQYVFYDRTSERLSTLSIANSYSCYKNYCLAQINNTALPNLK